MKSNFTNTVNTRTANERYEISGWSFVFVETKVYVINNNNKEMLSGEDCTIA
jgi:hypothetical protein